jgi:hypothetical protein
LFLFFDFLIAEIKAATNVAERKLKTTMWSLHVT